MASFLTKCKDKYISFRGFHTKRHLIIIESDDWGSIRTPSADIFHRLQEIGDHPEKDAFLSNDCLENEADLSALFDVLTSVRDKNGSPAIVTANFAMANPDFDKIDLKNGEYYYEPFYQTYQKYYSAQNVLTCVQEGINEKCFMPQLHCREHMNVNRWIRDLACQKKDTVIAFKNHMIGIGSSFSKENPFGYMDAFNSNFSTHSDLSKILRESMDIFRLVFGKISETFVASCFVWDGALEKTLCEIGVKGIQSGAWQNVPCGMDYDNAFRRRLHYLGQKNRFNQIYTVRNCTYEPAYRQNPKESMEMCFKQILEAFKNRKPAIINSHRFNYIRSINPSNSETNLEWLSNLLHTIVKQIPDVEFVSTAKLIEIMNQE